MSTGFRRYRTYKTKNGCRWRLRKNYTDQGKKKWDVYQYFPCMEPGEQGHENYCFSVIGSFAATTGIIDSYTLPDFDERNIT